MQIVIEKKKSQPIKQQMKPGDVDKWMREQPPPFASAHGLRKKDQRRVAVPMEQRPIQQEKKQSDSGQFKAKAR